MPSNVKTVNETLKTALALIQGIAFRLGALDLLLALSFGLET